jgi:hypothetical protein
MRSRHLVLTSAVLLLTLACSFGGEEEATPTITRIPTRTPGPTRTPTEDAAPAGGLDYRLDPNYGGVELASGFVPDPYTVGITGGGDVDVMEYQLGDHCYGYATSAPDFRLILADASQELRIFFVADVRDDDTILVVNTPDGGWLCNDDYGGEADPMLQLAPAPAGQYDIWVATYDDAVLADGVLYITERTLFPYNYREGSSLPPAGDSGLDYTLEPNYGEVELEPGFMPDPYGVDVASGGQVDVEALNIGPDCVGYATAAPDFRVLLEGDFSALRIYFAAADDGADTALIVNRPDGSWICDDDSGGGWNPEVDLAPAYGGQYDIWIGSYSQDEFVPGVLYITERPSGGPADGGNGLALDYSLEPGFGECQLEAQFWPDPYEVEMISGGLVDVAACGLGADCLGYAAEAPDYRLHLADSFSSLRIIFVADDPFDDTTMIINLPNGDWICGDDSGGTWNPMVELEPAAPGQYDIWVGSYSSEEYVPGSLYVTEYEMDPSDF